MKHPICIASLICLGTGCTGFIPRPGSGAEPGGGPAPDPIVNPAPAPVPSAPGPSAPVPSVPQPASDAGAVGGGGGQQGPRPDSGPVAPSPDARPAEMGGAPPPSAAVVCTSGRNYNGGNGSFMRPGQICQNCHSFSVAGTVFPTLHEPNNCNGASGSGASRISVEITGANGAVVTLAVNGQGNFYTRTQIARPFKARVIVDGRERAMVLPQMTGACNSCHTTGGTNLAPGRIMLP